MVILFLFSTTGNIFRFVTKTNNVVKNSSIDTGVREANALLAHTVVFETAALSIGPVHEVGAVHRGALGGACGAVGGGGGAAGVAAGHGLWLITVALILVEDCTWGAVVQATLPMEAHTEGFFTAAFSELTILFCAGVVAL